MTDLPAEITSEIPEDVAAARLPVSYEHAKTALAECQGVDECKDWADKAAALASYAKQAQDDELEALARRIRNRAIRRMGEVMQSIPAGKGGRPSEKLGDPAPLVSRRQAARDAGLSIDQQKQATRVANVPQEVFERETEAPKPATVKKLAEIGRKQRPSAVDTRPDAVVADVRDLLRAANRVVGTLANWQTTVSNMTDDERQRMHALASRVEQIATEIKEATRNGR